MIKYDLKFSCDECKNINEAINFELNCIFVAVPKTGTTSVRTQISSCGDYLVKNPHLTLNQLKQLIYPFLLKCNLRSNFTFPTDKDFPTDKQIFDFSEIIFKKMYKFGSVRNPWSRVYSLYTRREALQCEPIMSFSEFVNQIYLASDTCLHPFKTESQLDWFTDYDGNVIADYIYKIENLNDAISTITEQTNGKIVLQNRHLNRVNMISTRYQEVYSDRDKKIVERLFEKDIDYFKYTFK